MMFGAWGEPDHEVGVRIIDRALDAGINFIDTADVYARGESEEIVGKALAGGRRDNVVLATKFHGAMGDDANEAGNSRRWIFREVEASLKRLQTDWIDLYQVHRWDPWTDHDETLGALSDLSGRWRKGAEDLTSRRSAMIPDRYDLSIPANQATLDAADALGRLADDAGISLIHLTLAFVIRHPAVTAAIIGPRTWNNWNPSSARRTWRSTTRCWTGSTRSWRPARPSTRRIRAGLTLHSSLRLGAADAGVCLRRSRR